MKLAICNLLLVLLFFVNGCGDGSWKVVEVTSPAGIDSGEPFLVATNDEVWMSWLEKSGSGHALKLSRWSGEWSQPDTIVSGVPFFVNWADFPSILPLSGNRAVAHWLEKKGEGTYAYFVMTSISTDHGKTWSQPAAAHTDTSLTEHGFASLMDDGGGNYSIVWLDARNFKGDSHDPKNSMALMYSKVVPNQFKNEMTLDPRVCDCCQTAGVAIRDGLLIAYRDRSDQEIRDISYMRLHKNEWSQPKTIHADGWHIEGCPVNGPALDSIDNQIAVAWYSGANPKGNVRVSFSKDNGETFSSPISVDDGSPSGRVDVVLLEDGSAAVSWLENQEGKGASIRVRQIFPDGRTGKSITVADTTQARASGFPRMVRSGKDLMIAWTYAAEQSQIKVARIER